MQLFMFHYTTTTSKCFSTRLAHMLFFSFVNNPCVAYESGTLFKFFATNCALIWFVILAYFSNLFCNVLQSILVPFIASKAFHVPGQTPVLRKCFVTIWACEWFFPSMGSCVAF